MVGMKEIPDKDLYDRIYAIRMIIPFEHLWVTLQG